MAADPATLAMMADPFPYLQSVQTLPGSPLGMSNQFSNPGFNPADPSTFYGKGGNPAYAGALTQPTGTPSGGPPIPGQPNAALPPATMAQLASMMPKPGQQSYPGAVAPRGPSAINLNVGAGAAGAGAKPEPAKERKTLGQLLGLR